MGLSNSPLRRHVFPASTPGDALTPRSLLLVPFPEGSGSPRKRSPPSTRSCHSSSSFRPCRSSRLRRFTPLERLQVCCTLQPTMGFATFQVRGARVSRLLPQGELPRARLPAPLSRCGLPSASCSPSVRVSEEARQDWLPMACGSRKYRVHPRWRSTLRSFPLVDSRATSPWSLPSRHWTRGLPPLRSSSPGGIVRHGLFPRPLGLKALLRRRVRCALMTFPPTGRPLLPWASLPFQGLRLTSW